MLKREFLLLNEKLSSDHKTIMQEHTHKRINCLFDLVGNFENVTHLNIICFI